MSTSPLQRAVEHVGGQSALVRECQKVQPETTIKQAHVWYWLNKAKRVPAEHVLTIEAATGGVVPRHELRPDLYPVPEAAA